MTTRQLHPPRSQPLSSGSDSLVDENITLSDRVRELSRGLGASNREIAQLRRAVAQAQAENRRLRAALAAAPVDSDPRRHVRRMLSDPGSRNP